MSWRAKRYVPQKPVRMPGSFLLRSKKRPNQRCLPRRDIQSGLTQHHVPPSSKCKDPAKQFILIKSKVDHRAYHKLFGNPRKFSQALKVLRAYRQLFGDGKTFAEAATILKKYWWTPPPKQSSSPN